PPRARPPPRAAAPLRADLEAAGAQVLTLACDLADPDAGAGLLAEVRARGWQPHTVIHTAGVAGTLPLARTGPAEVAATLGAKTAGALALDALLSTDEVAHFVLFSSAAGVWGGAGQGAYAAANAYLDALAQRRRDRGLPATAVAWGRWAGEGMATGPAAWHLERIGLPAMAPATALEALQQALADGHTCVTVADVDWSRFAARYTAARPRPLISALLPAPTGPDDAPPGGVVAPVVVPAADADDGPARFRRHLADQQPAERQASLLALIRTETAAQLGHATASAVEPAQSFRDLGFDSMAAVGLRNRLGEATGLHLAATLVYDHETPKELAEHLACALAEATDPVRPAAPADPTSRELLGSVYRQLALLGKMKDAEGLLAGAASLRETFDDPDRYAGTTPFATLARGGPDRPALICFPPFAPVEGALQFARLAGGFDGFCDTSVLTVPGFKPAEPLAASREVLVDVLTDAAVRCAAGRPFVLLGYSSSGWLAHEVRIRLEARGRGPQGVVLLDTYLPASMPLPLRKAMNYEVIVRRQAFAALDYTALTAIGTYRRMFRGWEPARGSAPTLVVRPDECVPGSPDEPVTVPDWRSTWPHAHDRAQVRGDHCTMIGEHAAATAAVVRDWLTTLPARPDHPTPAA
ncbi:KR domain-containing protein, partial [Streptomyces sp. HSW2009]|uniref:KR domain-containing protein n=1 Tax=Streptomyces sp. HSW2009 TaxID=3142890 RepID=UPI0032EB0052